MSARKTRSIPAPDALVREAMRDEYLKCRTYQHGWDETIANDLDRPTVGWRLSLKCLRCETRRHDIISNTDGGLVRRNYDYPDGYQIDEKITRSELRLELNRRRDYDFIGARRKKRRAA